MASVNKKKKAKNSYIDGGAEKQYYFKCKRLSYYCKQDRIRNKNIKKYLSEYE